MHAQRHRPPEHAVTLTEALAAKMPPSRRVSASRSPSAAQVSGTSSAQKRPPSVAQSAPQAVETGSALRMKTARLAPRIAGPAKVHAVKPMMAWVAHRQRPAPVSAPSTPRVAPTPGQRPARFKLSCSALGLRIAQRPAVMKRVSSARTAKAAQRTAASAAHVETHRVTPPSPAHHAHRTAVHVRGRVAKPTAPLAVRTLMSRAVYAKKTRGAAPWSGTNSALRAPPLHAAPARRHLMYAATGSAQALRAAQAVRTIAVRAPGAVASHTTRRGVKTQMSKPACARPHLTAVR